MTNELRDRQPDVVIAGVYMDRSIADFQRACIAWVWREQSKPNPDTALIALLCDAVRCSRELSAVGSARLPEPPQ